MGNYSISLNLYIVFRSFFVYFISFYTQKSPVSALPGGLGIAV